MNSMTRRQPCYREFWERITQPWQRVMDNALYAPRHAALA